MSRPDWFDDAECRGMDPSTFVPERGNVSKRGNFRIEPRAIATCHRCPVRDECLDYALTTNQTGVWAGTNDAQRRAMRKHQNIKIGTRAAVADHLHANPDKEYQTAELARRFGVGDRSMSEHLRRLVREGNAHHRITFDGSRRIALWSAKTMAEVT